MGSNNSSDDSKNGGNSLTMIVSVGTVVGIVLLGFVILIYKLRKRSRRSYSLDYERD